MKVQTRMKKVHDPFKCFGIVIYSYNLTILNYRYHSFIIILFLEYIFRYRVFTVIFKTCSYLCPITKPKSNRIEVFHGHLKNTLPCAIQINDIIDKFCFPLGYCKVGKASNKFHQIQRKVFTG